VAETKVERKVPYVAVIGDQTGKRAATRDPPLQQARELQQLSTIQSSGSVAKQQ